MMRSSTRCGRAASAAPVSTSRNRSRLAPDDPLHRSTKCCAYASRRLLQRGVDRRDEDQGRHAAPCGAGRVRPMIDAHQHFIDPVHGHYPWIDGAYEPLRRRSVPKICSRSWTPAESSGRSRSRHGPSRPRRMPLLRIAAAEPWVAGVVGWVDLTDPAIADALAALVERPDGDRLVGIRHPAHDEPDPDWLVRADVGRGLAAVADAGLAFDLLVRARELPVGAAGGPGPSVAHLHHRPSRQARDRGQRARAVGVAPSVARRKR